MSSTPTFAGDIRAAVKAAGPRPPVAITVAWEARPTRPGGSWVLAARIGARVVSVDLRARPGDRDAAELEARTILTGIAQ